MPKKENYEGLAAVPAMVTALLEQSGVCDHIDELVNPDPQRILKPGKAVKLMAGALFLGMGRRPMYKLDRDYIQAPIDLMCGEGVTIDNINARAFSRALDDLFRLDLTQLTFDIYGILSRRYQLLGFIYNMDSTNFSVTPVVVERDDPDAAIPERNGHAKDGDNTKLVYNLQSVTDQNGILLLQRAYDGTVSDSEMDRDTVEFLADRVDTGRSTLVADSKLVNEPLIMLMAERGFGFVSKCPLNFGDKIREEIEYSVLCSGMDPSSYCDGWEVYDCDAVVDGIPLRFVAYRTSEGPEHDIEYLRVQGEREVSKVFKPFEKKLFACEEDARRTFDDALEGLGPSAYIVTAETRAVKMTASYGKRGRPPKSWTPEVSIQYMVDVSWEFSESLAEEMSSARQVRVLITNLPRSNESRGNPRDGATADDVLRIYMGQYRIEHAFRKDKAEFEIDTVYFHLPSRANAFFFVVSLCTMVSGIIDTVMRNAGLMKTSQGMIDDLSTLIVKPDRADSDIILSGDDVMADEYLRYLGLLGLDAAKLFSN